MRKHNTLVASDIDRLAELSRIRFDQGEKAALLDQLNDVFDIFAQLRAVDTDGVEPLTHPQAGALRQRADEVSERVTPAERDAIQQCAPVVERGLYLVPRVIE